jgi:hypothetical protein
MDNKNMTLQELLSEIGNLIENFEIEHNEEVIIGCILYGDEECIYEWNGAEMMRRDGLKVNLELLNEVNN